MALVLNHDDYRNFDNTYIELYATQRWLKVEIEGEEDFFYESTASVTTVAAASTDNSNEEIEMPVNIVNAVGKLRDDQIAQLPPNVGIDDDNMPAPENIPRAGKVCETVFTKWKTLGYCNRKSTGAIDMKARLLNVGHSHELNLVELFLHLFPKEYLKEVMVEETNKTLDGGKLTLGELLRWFGIWFRMATTYFENRRDFWSMKAITEDEGAPYRFNHLMTRTRFDAILSALQLTNRKPPSYKDPFWEVRQLMEEWNSNMDKNFYPSWVSCLDESMSKWLSQYTCPGHMCVPRKPWPFGNEYHTIACGETEVMYQTELVEGKDCPPERPVKQYDELGKTVGLLLRLTRPIWGSSRLVILDSGFCVLKGIVALLAKGVFASALIKKRKYWPEYIKGDAIAAHFKKKEVGAFDCWQGELSGKKVSIHCMKEPDYIMSLMTTYGSSERVGEIKHRTYQVDGMPNKISFMYPEVIFNHFEYRDAVDQSNGKRMDPISFEETWKTKRWPLRCLQFFIAITEVNCRCTKEHIYFGPKMSQQEFRKTFCKQMIHNKYYGVPDTPTKAKKKRKWEEPIHELVALAPFTNFKNTKIVKSKTRCTQRICQCKARRVNTYCRCMPGTLFCPVCYTKHISDIYE